MRVAQLTPYLSPEYGSYEYNLSKALVEKGHEVVIFTSLSQDPRYYANSSSRGLKQFCNLDGVKIVRCKVAGYIGEHKGLPISAELIYRLTLSKLEVFHAHDFHQFFTLAGFLASRLKRKPLIITQNAYADMPLLYSSKRAHIEAFKIFKTTIGKLILKGTYYFTALTPLARNYLINMGVPEDKVMVMPIGVDVNLFSPSTPRTYYKEKLTLRDEPVVLCVSRLIKSKGIHVLLQALKKVAKTFPDAKLVVVGCGPYYTELVKLTNILNLKKKVYFTGFIPHRDMPLVYAVADVFVLPTLTVEVFGMAAIEAMATGLPVIASDLGGLKSIVDEECGFSVEPNNPDALADKIILLLSDKKLRRRLATNTRKKAIEMYDWSVIAEKTLKIYEEAIEQCT